VNKIIPDKSLAQCRVVLVANRCEGKAAESGEPRAER